MDNSRKKRIAVVIPKYGTAGGAELFASELTSRVARGGEFDVHVFANRWADSGAPVSFHRVPIARFPRFLRPLSFSYLAERQILRGGFDLVHSHERISSADIFSVHSVPHAGWVRDVRAKRPSLFDRAVSSVERKMVSSGGSSWFLPVSSLAEEAFRREYGQLPGTWEVMSPGVDYARFSTPEKQACRAEVRARHGIGDGDFLILFVGMNFEVKGLAAIIEALAVARAANPGANVRLLVVGRGDEKRYAQLARKCGSAEAVVFAGVRTGGLERYYRAADAFAMLSAFDTFGMVVLEAMAAGLPVLVSKNVGAKDLVAEGVNGFVLDDPSDAPAGAERISWMIAGGRWRVMGQEAARTAASHDWEAAASRMRALYLKLLSRAGRRP